jgi:hypothetical protein
MNNDFIIKPTNKKPQNQPSSSPLPVSENPMVTKEDKILEQISTNIASANPSVSTDKSSKKGKKRRLNPRKWFLGLSKKKQISVCVIASLFLILSSAGLVYAVTNKKAPAPAPIAKVESKQEPAKPLVEPSRLTGLPIAPELNKRAVTGIMIENSPDARPQSALNQAGVVFEAVAEGGITRFLTLFQESQPDYIGPVRSVRPYYLDWLQGFDAAIVHAGGSAEGLAKIRSDGVKDLDHGANGAAFTRVSNRVAPHNLYTTSAKLDEISKQRGFTSSTFEGFPRKIEKALATPTAKGIDFSISSFLYNARYDYDAASNSYLRSEGGRPHTDEKSGAQLAPKVVIAIVMNYSQRGIYSVYNSVGSGKAYVFQDGGVTEGTWSKTSAKSQITFTDSADKPLKLNPGQTWISTVNGADKVKYTP